MKIFFLFFQSLILLFYNVVIVHSGGSGFWYGETRGPLVYDSVPYSNLTVKINLPYQNGPGQNLFSDPSNPHTDISIGNTINRQSFDTQFVLDIAHAISLDYDRIYVTQVVKGNVHFSWESTSVLVYFMILERNNTNEITLIEAISNLTAQVQTKSSRLFHGTNVTNYLDPDFGLKVVSWDVSLRLTYAIEVIGGNSVIDGYYLNYGSLGFCDNWNLAAQYEQYCEFERFFEDDISKAINLAYYRTQILFIKKAAQDAVLIYFRILPPKHDVGGIGVAVAIADLLSQVPLMNSTLYSGNVTIRVDPTWGVSGVMASRRMSAALFTLKYYDYDPHHLSTAEVPLSMRPPSLVTSYDRCKANRRCVWGVTIQNQSTNEVLYYHQLFYMGQLFPIQLYLDFEDWRMGTRGFNWYGDIPPTAQRLSIPTAAAKAGAIRGAHFWPFSTKGLGTDIPCYMRERNQGLVLDRSLQHKQIGWQQALVYDIKGRIDWIDENIEDAIMSATLRSRKDVRREMTKQRGSYSHWLHNEMQELHELNSSQCASSPCTLLFNTSSLTMTGVVTATGVVGKTSGGVEVAVFNFNSIYLGPEVDITLVGQRALALVSRTTAVINTTIVALPGTLGGFLGGYSAGKLKNESLSDHPRDVLMCELGGYCLQKNYSIQGTGVPTFTASEKSTILQYNVNGPGSGNLLVYPFTIRTTATNIPEVQVIRTYAQSGQTLAGGFTVQFGPYITPIIPYDASASMMKEILENNLNIAPPLDFPIAPNRYYDGTAGVGILNVSRSSQDSEEGYVWRIVFTTAIGNIAMMKTVSYLQGLHAYVNISTETNGNELGGHFKVSFKGYSTPPIYPDDSAIELKQKLLTLPSLVTVFVDRIDPTKNCNDGLCANSPLPARGMLWTVVATVNSSAGDITPSYPAEALSYTDAIFSRSSFSSDSSKLTGQGANVNIQMSLKGSRSDMLSLLDLTSPFPLAYGGGGGSHGGLGGQGYGETPIGSIYGDREISDLLGGSGGSMRGQYPFDSNAFLSAVVGRGGHGGGAIEIVSAIDIVIGTFGKFVVSGGDAEQTSEGGGGGGSGGSIVLAAAGTVLFEGEIEAHGGDGGFGGNGSVWLGGRQVGLAGGGGGGGRVAMYGDSVTIASTSRISVNGGKCGILKTSVNTSVLIYNTTVEISRQGYLDHSRLIALSESFLNKTFEPSAIYFQQIDASRNNGTTLNFIIMFSFSLSNNDTLISFHMNYKASQIRNYVVADIVYYSVSVDSLGFGFVNLPNKISFGCTNNGQSGTLYTETTMTSAMYINRTGGAEDTTSALFLSNRESTKTSSGSVTEAPFSWNGPMISFAPSHPTRVTYYTKLGAVTGESRKSDYGALFALISRGESELNISAIIGVFLGERIKHGSNFQSAVDEHLYFDALSAIDNYPILNLWYKVDIRINWQKMLYSILLNDTLVTGGNKFTANQIDGVRLSVHRAVDVWFDEVYVGFDSTLGFQCPSTSRKGVVTNAPDQNGWSYEEVHGVASDGYTVTNRMSRHYNNLNPTNMLKFDGQGEDSIFEDIKLKYADGDYPIKPAKLHAGALKYLQNTQRSGRPISPASETLVSKDGLYYTSPPAGDGRYFWYMEHNNNATNNTNNAFYGYNTSHFLSGGIGSCSTYDLRNWRFEGIVLPYLNVSDLVYGSQGPFTLERPTVIWNQMTKQYVMWATMNDIHHKLGQSIVATSPYEDGPFLFRRSFYPDGNKTRDQTTFIDTTGRGVLGRTYFSTVEYLMPEAVMQPVWESVKFRNGTEHFSLNYHRAHYHLGYDNFHDIYLQRWRKEDQPWSVYCVNRITKEERLVPYGTYNDVGEVCNHPDEYKVVVGQGNPFIKSRFLSPNESDNSWWMQTSVPSVKAQPWLNNYMDGTCGIRKLDDDHDVNDPELESFTPTSRKDCSNIADNPIHPTLQDKLIGVMRILTSRRAKYIAISELTNDYLDTTGILKSIEGELETGNLISMITSMGQFGFSPGFALNTTFLSPRRAAEFHTAYDFRYRFRQFLSNYNDRAEYALACVIDGVCQVNYADQLTSGQY